MRKIKSPLIPLLSGMLIASLSLCALSRAGADGQKLSSESSSAPALGIGIPDTKSSASIGLDASSSGKLLFSLALIIGGYGLFVKYRGNRSIGALPSELSITSKLMLTPRTALLLVKVHGRSVLCAVGPEQVSIIPTEGAVSAPFDDFLGNEESLDEKEVPKTGTNSPAERSIS